MHTAERVISGKANPLSPTTRQEIYWYQLLFFSLVASQQKRCVCLKHWSVQPLPGRPFFRHQNSYLQPAVDLVWEHHTEELLDKLRWNKDGLALKGYGRADSPGHSAKYGSYTLLELSCNKVVDFQLVQVRATCIFVTVSSQCIISVHYREMKLVGATTWRRNACIGPLLFCTTRAYLSVCW